MAKPRPVGVVILLPQSASRFSLDVLHPIGRLCAAALHQILTDWATTLNRPLLAVHDSKPSSMQHLRELPRLDGHHPLASPLHHQQPYRLRHPDQLAIPNSLSMR